MTSDCIQTIEAWTVLRIKETTVKIFISWSSINRYISQTPNECVKLISKLNKGHKNLYVMKRSIAWKS
jgi:hypothetical protein